MANFRITDNQFGPTGADRSVFEVPMIANKNGEVVTILNPFPVTQVGPRLDSNSYNTSTSTDAFTRLRVSDPYTLFDSTLRFGDDTRNWSTSNTSGSSYANVINESTVSMSVANTAGQKVIRQTKRYFQYQPGKSLLFLNSMVMNEGKTGLRQRVGNFDANNGIFFEQSNNINYIVKRSNTTGTPTDTRIPQSQWSVDTLDGTYSNTNPSGISLDTSKAQIQWTDLEWLGVGTVRSGFIINGQFILCHTFHHANIANSVYMTSATLPIRYEIENIANTSTSSTLKHICNSVISEGGYSPSVTTRAISTSLSGISMSQSVYRPLVAIRLKSGFVGSIVVPSSADLYGIQTTPFNFKILQGCTISGGTWVSAGTESAVEYNITATGLSGGRNFLQGMFIGGIYTPPRTIDFRIHNSSYALRNNLDGTNEIFCVAAIATTNNDDALAALVWEEFN